MKKTPKPEQRINSEAKPAVRGRPFKKGESGNPNGRPPLPEDVRRARALTTAKFQDLANKMFRYSREQLEQIQKNPKTPALKALVAQIMIKAIDQGDTARMNTLLDRTIGKVPQRHDLGLAGTLEDLVAGSWGDKGGDG